MPENNPLSISSPYVPGSTDNSSILQTYVPSTANSNIDQSQLAFNNQFKMIQDAVLGTNINHDGQIKESYIKTPISQSERYNDSELGFNPLRDNEDLYAKDQGFFNSVGKGLGRLVLTTGTKLGQGVGYLGGLLGIDNHSDKYGEGFSSWVAGAADNGLAKMFENSEEGIKNDWMKIYQRTANKEQGFFSRAANDLSFWTSDVSDGLAFMASSLIPGMLLSKLSIGARAVSGLRLLEAGAETTEGFNVAANTARAASIAADEAMAANSAAQGLVDGTKLLKWISNAKLARSIDAALMTSVNSASEAMFEASQTKDDIIRSLRDTVNPKTGSIYTPEELNMAAAVGARNTFGLNMIALAPSSLWEAGLILKKLPSNSLTSANRIAQETLSSEARLIPLTVKQRVASALKSAGTGVLAEGIWEENIQNAIQRVNKYNAGTNKSLTGTLSDVISQYGKQSIETLKGNDAENSIAVGIGALMGLGGGVISNIRETISEEKRLAETTKRINAAKSSLFSNLGSVYETEDVEVKNEDGTTKTVKKYKTDSEGNLIADANKIEAFINNQSEIFEIQDLIDIADKDKNTTLSNIYKNKLFTEFVKSHLDSGNIDSLLEKLDNLNNVKGEDLALLGFDPESKKDAPILIEKFKAKAVELQRLYDSIQGNIIAPTNSIENNSINEARKGEIFRLSSTASILLDEIRDNRFKANTLLAKINAYDPTNNSINDGIVDEANIRYASVKAAQKYLDDLVDKSLINTDEEYDIESAEDKVASTTKYYNQYIDDNKDQFNSSKKNDEGYHEYENEAKNNTLDKRDLELLNFKIAELSLNRGETLTLIEKYSNRTKGFNYYKNNIVPINENRSTNRLELFRLKGKTLDQYLANEARRLRKERITSSYNDIMKKYQAEFLADNLSNMSFNELDQLVNDLLNNDYALTKESLDLLKNKYNAEILSRKIELEQLISKATQRVDDIYAKDDMDITEDEIEEAAYITNTTLPSLNDKLNELTKQEEKLNKLKEYKVEDFDDNTLKYNIANGYLKEGKKIISDINQSTEGYDQQEDLDKVNDELEEANQLLSFFQTRNDLNDDKPKLDKFIDQIQSQIDDLNDAKRQITARVNDRALKDNKVLNQYVTQSFMQNGINRDDTLNDLHSIIRDTVSIDYKAEYDKIMNLINDSNPLITNIEKLAASEALSDLLKISYNKLSDTKKEDFNKRVSSYQNTIADNLKQNKIVQSYNNIGSMTDVQMINNFKKNPQSFIKLLLGTKDVRVTDKGKLSAVYKFLQDNDLQNLYDNSLVDDRLGSIFDQNTLIDFVNDTISYVSTIDLLNSINSKLSNINEIKNEISIIEESINESKKNKQSTDKVVQTPSNQQLIALRELSSFFFNSKPNELYNAFAYLKGVAGAGKSLVVARWLPRLLRISKNEILATGHNQSSSETINNALGLSISPTFENVLEILETNNNIKLVIIDEVGGINREQLDSLALIVANKNINKTSDNQIKVVLLGDPNQLNSTTTGLSVKPDIEAINTLDPVINNNNEIIQTNNLINNVTIIRPLTIRYRSNVSSVSNFSDKFIDQDNDLTNTEIISTSNNPTLDITNIRNTNNLIGVIGSLNIEADILKVLLNSNLDDNRSRAIITNPDKIEKYKDLLRANNIPLTKVEVLSYVTAQGRTIDQVYIDITNNSAEFSTTKIFNKAMYVASSRATEFTLVSNFNMVNEIDNNIINDKLTKDKEVNDSSNIFLTNRQLELNTITGLIGENTISQLNNVAPIPTEIGTNTDTTINTSNNIVEVSSNDNSIESDENEDTYDDQGEIDNNNLSTDENTVNEAKDILNIVPNSNVDTDINIIHNLAFPSSLSTKNIINIDDNIIRLSDNELKLLNKRGSNLTIVNPSIKNNDVVYYVPVIGDNNNIYFSIVSPLKDINNKNISNKYRQIGVISDKEYQLLSTNVDQKVLYDKLELAKKNNKVNQISLSSSEFTNNNLIIAAEGTIASSNFLTFVYNPDSYKQFSLRSTIENFVKGFFREDEADSKKINNIQKAAKILIFKKSQIKALNKDLVSGVPYLVIDNIYQGSSNTKGEKMYIRLDRKRLNKNTHNDILNPIYTFINNIKELENLSNLKYGTEEFNTFIKEAHKTITPTNIYTSDIIKLAKSAYELYKKEVPINEVKVGTKVKYSDTSKSFNRIGYYKENNEEKGHIKGQPYIINTSGKVVETREGRDTYSHSITITQVKVKHQQLINNIKQDVISDWIDIQELKVDNIVDGLAQASLDRLFRSNKNLISKNEVASQKFNVNGQEVISGFSLLNSKYNIDIDYLESLFSNDNNGDNAFGFRVPVPIKSDKVNFTNQGNNSVSDKKITDYYLQSNFDKVIPTRISIITGKTKSKVEESKIEVRNKPNSLIGMSINDLSKLPNINNNPQAIKNYELAFRLADEINNSNREESISKILELVNNKFIERNKWEQVLSNKSKLINSKNYFSSDYLQKYVLYSLKDFSSLENNNNINNTNSSNNDINDISDDELLDDFQPRITPGRRLDQDKYKDEELGKSLNKTQILSVVKNMLPGLTNIELSEKVQLVNDITMMRLTGGKKAWGLFQDGIIYLNTSSNTNNDLAKEKAAKHEVFHMIFNNYLTNKERLTFISKLKEVYPGLAYMTNDEQLEFVDEYLAEQFQNYTPNKNLNYYINYILRKIGKLLSFLSPNIKSFNNLFDSINQGYFTTPSNENIGFSVSRTLSNIKRDYEGSTHTYRIARDLFSDMLDQFMHPTSDVIEVNNKLKNVPLTRGEAVEMFKKWILAYKKRLSTDLNVNDDNYYTYKALEALSTINPDNNKWTVLDNLIKEFYPNFEYKKSKDSNEVTIREIEDEDDYTDILSDDITNINSDEEQSEADGDEALKNRENWNNDEDTVNPLRKASQAVKDIMSNVLVTVQDNIRERVKPGYVFFKLLQNVSNIDISDLNNFNKIDTSSEEKRLIKNNFLSNGMVDNNDDSNRDYQIYKKLERLLDQSNIKLDKEGNILPNNSFFKWVGDNQKGHYIFSHNGNSIDLNNQSVEDIYKNVNQFSNLSYDIINRLYQKTEAADAINSIYYVVNSLRAKYPMFAEFEWKFTNNSKQYLSRKYGQFKEEYHLAPARSNIENILTTNYEKLTKYENDINKAKLDNKDTVRLVKSILKDTNMLLTKRDIFISTSEANNMINVFSGIITLSKQINNLELKDDDNNSYFYSGLDLVNDSKSYIKSIVDIVGRSEKELGRNSSYRGADNKQRWFHMLSNQALDVLDGIINNKPLKTYLKNTNSIFNYNIFNPVESNNYKLNTIHSFRDHDSIENVTEGSDQDPTTYRKEDRKAWFDRNFFYGFTRYISSNTKNGTRYIQQFYTISNKPNIISAEIDVLKHNDIKAAIKTAIIQEANRSASNIKNYSKNIKNNVTSLIGLDRALTKEEIDNSVHLNTAVEDVYKAMSNRAETILDNMMDLNITLDKDFIDSVIKLHGDKFVDPKFSLPSKDIRSIKGNYRSDNLKSEAERLEFKGIVLPIFDIYYKNYFINSLFLNQLISGDQSQFKNAYDQVKRMSMVFATGSKGRVNNANGLKRTFKVAVVKGIEDVKLDTDSIFNVFKRLQGKSYEITDAQGLIIPERAENIRRGFSKEANLGATMKPVYYGIGDDGIARGIKYSTIEISNELAKAFPELSEIRYQMTFGNNSNLDSNDRVRELYNKLINNNNLSQSEYDEYQSFIDQVYSEDSAIDELVFDSAFKVGAPNNVTIYDKDNFKIDNNSTVVLNNAYYRHQLNPRHDADGKTSNPSQLTYQINTNGKNFNELYKVLKLNSIIHYNGVEDFMNDFLPDGEVNSKSITKIKKMLSTTLSKVPGNERVVEFLENDMSLNIPFIVNKLVQTFNAKMSKSTVQIKHKGSKLILQSMFGTSSSNILNDNSYREPRLVFTDNDGNEVSEGNNAKSYHMEVYMPNIYKGKLNMNESIYYDSELYNTLMGFRIPSTELHSAVPLKIIGFYPSQYGDNIIIAPKELVLLHGSDFDIDSLYTINPYIGDKDIYTLDTKKLISQIGSRIGYTDVNKKITKKDESFTEFLLTEINKYKNTDDNIKLEYLKDVKSLLKKAASNEILESFVGIITDNKNLQDMMTPITLAQLNDIEDPNSVFYMMAKLNAKKLGETLSDIPETNENNQRDIWIDKAMNYIRSSRNLNDIQDEMLMHKDNFQSAMLTGMFANAFKAISYIFMGTNKFDSNNNLTEEEQELPKFKDNVSKFKLEFKWDNDIYDGFNRYVKEDGKLQNGTSGTSRNTTWQTLDALINAAIDHVKEQILNIINASDKTGNAIAAATAMGIPITKTSLFMMQPTIQEISNQGKFMMNNIREEIKGYLFDNELSTNSALRNSLNFNEEENNEDWKKTIKENEIYKKFLDKINDEVNNTPITTKLMEDGYMLDYKNLSQSNRKDLIFQLRVLKEFEKLSFIGDNITTTSMAIKSVQSLPSEFSGLEILEERYNKLFDLETAYHNVSPININDQNKVEIADSYPFSNVNISNIPNVASSLYVIKTLMNNIGKVFLKNSDDLRMFANDIDDLAQSKGVNTEDINDENTVPKTYKTSFIMKGVKAKGLQLIRDNFVEYLLSGASYVDSTGRTYSMDTTNESKIETTAKRYMMVEEIRVKTDTTLEYSGLAAWNIKFIDRGYITTLPDGRVVKMLSLKEIKNKYQNENYFLKNLEIKLARDKYNRDTGIPYLRMTIGGSLDNAEKIDYQNDFENLKNYSIYVDENNNPIDPELLANDEFNEFQHNLLKYSVLNQGLAFGSQNFSSLMSPLIFKKLSEYLDNNLKETSTNINLLDNIKEHFLPQILLNNINRLSSLNRFGVEFPENSRKEPLAGFEEDTYFDAKIDLNKANRSKSTLPIYAKYGSGLYLQVNVTDNNAYYQRISRVQSNKSYQFSNSVKTNGYQLKDYFSRDKLGIGVKSIEDIGNNQYQIDLLSTDQKSSIIKENDTIFVYNDSDITRISGSEFKVDLVRFNSGVVTYNLSPIGNMNADINISSKSTNDSLDELNEC